MATYTPNIPQPSDIPAVSQDQILQNFQSIDDATNGFALNHVTLTNATVGQRGKHNMMQMPEQTIVPSTAVNEGALYTKDDGTRTALYWRQENNGTEIKMTGLDPLSATSGYTFLGGGFLFVWGQTAFSNSTNISVTFPLTFTTVFQVTFSVEHTAGNVNSNNTYINNGTISTTGFSVRNPDGHTWRVHYMAIGV